MSGRADPSSKAPSGRYRRRQPPSALRAARVSPVRVDDGRDVELLARLGPQCLLGVHGAAVGLQRNDLAVGAREGGAGRQRHPIADRTTREFQVIVRRSCVEQGIREGPRDGLVARPAGRFNVPKSVIIPIRDGTWPV